MKTCVATGGGIVTEKRNWGKMQTGMVVWLDMQVKEATQKEEECRTIIMESDGLVGVWSRGTKLGFWTVVKEEKPQASKGGKIVRDNFRSLFLSFVGTRSLKVFHGSDRYRHQCAKSSRTWWPKFALAITRIKLHSSGQYVRFLPVPSSHLRQFHR